VVEVVVVVVGSGGSTALASLVMVMLTVDESETGIRGGVALGGPPLTECPSARERRDDFQDRADREGSNRQVGRAGTAGAGQCDRTGRTIGAANMNGKVRRKLHASWHRCKHLLEMQGAELDGHGRIVVDDFDADPVGAGDREPGELAPAGV
jgi:hypothetical protein